ncbi:MAG: hypothetical protein WCC60_20845 [Ilumatobacteraceae bacterium]
MRSTFLCMASMTLLAACTQPPDRIAGGQTSSSVEVSSLQDGRTTERVDTVVAEGDPWADAVRAAEVPIAVAYGLPDDLEKATAILADSYERKRAKCMRSAGFDFLPELAGDAAAAEANASAQNALTPDERLAHIAMYDSCTSTAAEQTFLANALGIADGPAGSEGQLPAELSTADTRAAEILIILKNRDLIQRLAASLDRGDA